MDTKICPFFLWGCDEGAFHFDLRLHLSLQSWICGCQINLANCRSLK
jgi:hypothetical protein